ncbi:MAG: hypothetical protein Q8L66_14875 [Caulobacter sp.]|nr:hypothetical protein [Caulobacter sp.]
MNLAAGTKLASAVCSAQGIIIRPPSESGVLTCGGEPVTAPGAGGGAAQLSAPVDAPALIGKRYVDETVGLEVLCIKGGKGAFAFEGRPLTLKEAKPLPASD